MSDKVMGTLCFLTGRPVPPLWCNCAAYCGHMHVHCGFHVHVVD